eukprot:1182569-Prorocentrum_minimum.AAC.6
MQHARPPFHVRKRLPVVSAVVSRSDTHQTDPTSLGAYGGRRVTDRDRVSKSETPSAVGLAVDGSLVAVAGGTGWKQRSPYLSAQKISTRDMTISSTKL